MKFLHLLALATLIGCHGQSVDSQSEDSFGSGDIDFTECDGQVEFNSWVFLKYSGVFFVFLFNQKLENLVTYLSNSQHWLSGQFS